MEAIEVSGHRVEIDIVPHSKFPNFRRPKRCFGAFGDFIGTKICICADHTKEELLQYIVEHERVEMLLAFDPSLVGEYSSRIPIEATNPHDLANSVIYQLAAQAGELELLHANWIVDGEVKESRGSRQYRDRLYAYYCGSIS